MKLTKMSLVAALLVSTSAFAVDNIQVSGDANLFYNTTDAKNGMANALNSALADTVAKDVKGTLFDKDSSAADASLNLAISADLAKNDLVTVSAKAGYTVLSTLGLENNFVSGVWGSSHGVTMDTGSCVTGPCHSTALGDLTGGAKVENANYVTEAFVTVASGNSAVQLGRMELDTPIAFTEKWSAEKNTFEAAVVMNKDIPDTTVVAAYVGNGNGNEIFGQRASDVNVSDVQGTGTIANLALATGGVVNANGTFNTFGTDGAYALGVINNSFKPLTVQAWYYNVSKLVTSYWLQADLACEMVPGLMAGVQYNAMEAVGTNTKEDNVYAAMLGYEMKDVVTVKVAYSAVNDNGTLKAAGFNAATSTGDTKLYTKTFWNYGKNVVTAQDTESMRVSVSSPVNGLFDVCASYTSVDQSEKAGNADLDEIALVVKKSFGPLDAQLAYVYVNEKNKTTTLTKTVVPQLDSNFDGKFDDKYSMVQAYLTLNF